MDVERPMRRRWQLTQASIALATASKPFLTGKDLDQDKVRAALADLLDTAEDTEAAFTKRLLNACTARALPRSPHPSTQAIAPPRSSPALLIARSSSSRSATVVSSHSRYWWRV